MRDRDLVRLYWPVDLRPAFDTLMGVDDVMGDIVASSSQPALGAIRLAWWRDALLRLDTAAPPPEPRLQAVARELLPRGISGAELSGLEQGWATLLDERPQVELVNQRGAMLFQMGATLLGVTGDGLPEAGALYATLDVQRRGIGAGRSMAPGNYGRRFPSGIRPMTALAALAARDLRRDRPEPEATPARAFALLRHRLTGGIE